VATNPAYASEWQLQRQYDIAYQQCMYAKGNLIPGVVRRQTETHAAPPQPQGTSSGLWVTVPGQYVNGKWVPEHKVFVPSGSPQQATPPGPPTPRPGP
jgi:hypothetical protein